MPNMSYNGQEYEWANDKFYNYAPYQPPTREEVDAERGTDPTANWDWQNEQQLGPQGQNLPPLATGWQPNGEADFGTGFKGWWNKAYSNVSQAWDRGYSEGLSISGATEFVIKKTQGEDVGAQTIEQMKEARKPQDENAALWDATLESSKEVFSQALWGGLDLLGAGALFTEKVLGSTGYALADVVEGKSVDWQANWNASQLAFAGIFDASIYEELNRKIESGIRPDLAKQEEMIAKPWTMWIELFGNMLYDPLNLISVWGKAGEALKMTKSAQAEFHTIANPEVEKMVGQAMETIARADETTAYRNVVELAKSQQGLAAAYSHAEDIAQTEKGLVELSKSYQMGQLTASGKLAHLANQTNEVAMHIVNNSDPHTALDILWGMKKSTSKDPAEAAEGIATMLRFADPIALFSEAGKKTTVMISKVFEKYGDNWLNTLEEFKGNPAELVKQLLGRMNSVGEDMFPSVSKMLEAEKAVKAGAMVDEATKALAERAGQLPSLVRKVTRFHDAAQKVIGPINKGFISVYMGWNPGFAFRNFANNSMQLLIDYGPGVLLGKADDVFAKAEKFHGGVLQGAFSEGGMAAALFPEKIAQRETGVKAVLTAAKSKLKAPILGASQVAEANAAKRVIAKTYMQTFERGMNAMVKAMTPDLKAAGFSEDILKKLPTYIMQNDGDATRIVEALRGDVASGTIDLFNDISRIDPKYKSFLSDAGKWDEYAEKVLRAGTPEEAKTAAARIFDDLAEASDHVFREERTIVSEDDKFLKMAEQEGNMPTTRSMVIGARISENEKVIKAAEDILSEADNLGAKMGLDVGSMKKARGITGGGALQTSWGTDAAKEKVRLRDLGWELTERSKKGGADLKSLWYGYPEFFPGEPPKDLNPKVFRDALWHQYDAAIAKNFAGARDLATSNVKDFLDDLEAAGAQIPPDWRTAIDTALEHAKQYDDVKIGRFKEWVHDTPVPYGTRTTQISQLAAKYGFETATTEGAALDKKTLSMINEYAEAKYTSLEEVPLNVAEQAFAKKAGKDLGPFQSEQELLKAVNDRIKMFQPDAPEVKSVSEIPKGFVEQVFGSRAASGSDAAPQSVYDIANEFGIPSASPSDARMDEQILNTVNKYLPDDLAGKPQVPSQYDPGSYELEKGITRKARIQEIQEYVRGKYEEKFSNYSDVGIRIQEDVYKEKVGDVFQHEPFHWIEGEQTTEKVGGVSALDMDGVLDRGSNYDGNVIFVLGSKASSEGADAAEIVMKNPVVLEIIDDRHFFDKSAKFKEYTRVEDIPPDAARAAFEKRAVEKGLKPAAETAAQAAPPGAESIVGQRHAEDLKKLGWDTAHFDESGKLVEPARAATRVLPPPAEEAALPVSRAIHEQMDKVGEMRKWMMDDIGKNFGKKQVVDRLAESTLQKAEKELTQKLAETRLISTRVAQANRNFTLLNYGEKSYFDVGLAYLYPFHFWYKGTYKNWLTRIASNPSVLGNYDRYKRDLATIHAGMPEWWKYNINTNDLPGIHTDHPLYLNLEATLWPLNGLTNVDFNDPQKRVGWWTSTLDFANKFGPSTWSPINIVTGLALRAKGETEAGDKWMGRLFPQSATIKAGASLLGIANLETDPFVSFLQGGLDPNERRRVGAAFQQLEAEGNYTEAQLNDAAYAHEGPIWDEAVKRAVHGRAPAQLASFLFGVGVKPRTEQDQQVDKFYNDYNRLWTMSRGNTITTDEFKQGMDKLKEQYPFMDTVLLSRRSGVERDAGLAYNVLARIPPGQTAEIAKAAGLAPDMLDKFFNDKGQIDRWPKEDYTRFMSGVLTIAAVLEVPNDMTRKEWTSAKSAYQDAMNEGAKQFGADIWDKVDGYFAAKTQSYDAASAYLDKHPEVQQALDWKAQRVMNSPLLSAYYGGASMVEGYYRSQMYTDIETKLGKDIFDTMTQYNDLKTYGNPGEAKQFYNQHKAEIRQYYSLKDQWQVTIDQNTARLSAHMPEGQGIQIRQDINPNSIGAQNLAGALGTQQQQPTFEEFQAQIPTHVMSLVQDYFNNGERLTESAEKQLGRLAYDLGYADANELLQAIGTSMYQTQPP